MRHSFLSRAAVCAVGLMLSSGVAFAHGGGGGGFGGGGFGGGHGGFGGGGLGGGGFGGHAGTFAGAHAGTFSGAHSLGAAGRFARQLGPRRLAWRTLAWWSPVRRRLGLGRRVGISLLGLRLRLRLRLWLLRPQCLLRISWLCLRVWLLSGGSPKSSERKQPRRFCRRALCLLLCHARYGAVGLRLWLAQKAHPGRFQ